MTCPGRVRVAILAIIVSGVISGAYSLWSLRPDPVAGADDVSRLETRLRRLKMILPAQGIVGYVSDPERPGAVREVEYAKRLYLTQYTLAPLIVQEGSEAAFVVGHFSTAKPDALSAAKDLVLVEDFGEGLFLWRRRER